MFSRRTGLATLCLLGLAAVRAETPTDPLVDAIDTWDTNRLQLAAGQTSDPGRAALARAVLDIYSGRDAVAIDALEALTAAGRLDAALRFVAFRTLAHVDLRNQRYVRAAGALEAALASPVLPDGDALEEVADDLRFARAHRTVRPMTMTVGNAESVALVRDVMDLPRASVDINDRRVDAILDTGASDSVVSISTARRLRLRVSSFQGGVAADGRPVVARFAVAETLAFAGRSFRNVPFIVLPDDAVNVPLGDGVVGRFEPIIGLSVLRKLGRIEIESLENRETLRVGVPVAGEMEPNLLLPEGLPLVRVRAGDRDTELRMSLDTGSNRTSLTPETIAANPGLAGEAIRGRVGMASAAGVRSDDAGSIIPRLALKLGAATVPLSKVPVAPGPRRCDGTLGQDVLRSGGGYAIDFNRMTIELLPGTSPR